VSSLDHQPARAISPARRDGRVRATPIFILSPLEADPVVLHLLILPPGLRLAGIVGQFTGFQRFLPRLLHPHLRDAPSGLLLDHAHLDGSATVFLMRKSPMLIDAWLISSLHGRASRYPAVRYSSPRARHRRHRSGAIPKAQPAALGDYHAAATTRGHAGQRLLADRNYPPMGLSLHTMSVITP